jgi:predicted dinucleotide-binding enzyme
MKIGILGTGQVATTIGKKLHGLGHQVSLGSRTRDNERAVAWVGACGEGASQGTFAEAARFGELVWNCTAGEHSLEAVEQARADNLRGKTLVDVANPLDFTLGFPPMLSVCNTTSLGEQIQAALPETRVVKTLNTVTAALMVDPGRIEAVHDVFVSGNSPEAKAEVQLVLEQWFGWKRVIDLGDITTARGTEAYLLLWTRLYGVMQTSEFNVQLVRAK